MARAWKPLMWVPASEVIPNVDKLVVPSESSGLATVFFDRDYDYRLTFDSDRGLWRLDQRRHVDGG